MACDKFEKKLPTFNWRLYSEMGDLILRISDGLADEGDRIYLGSTNEAEDIKDLGKEYFESRFEKTGDTDISYFDEVIEMLERLSKRCLEYVGEDEIEAILDCDIEIQKMARAGIEVVAKARVDDDG